MAQAISSENYKVLRSIAPSACYGHGKVLPFKDQLEMLKRGRMSPKEYIVVTPFSYRSNVYGMQNLPLIIRADHFINKLKVSHHFEIDDLVELPEMLSNHVLSFESKEDRATIVFLTQEFDKKHKPILVPVVRECERKVRNVHGTFNIIPTIYGKDDLATMLFWEMEYSRKFFVNEKTAGWLEQFPSLMRMLKASQNLSACAGDGIRVRGDSIAPSTYLDRHNLTGAVGQLRDVELLLLVLFTSSSLHNEYSRAPISCLDDIYNINNKIVRRENRLAAPLIDPVHTMKEWLEKGCVFYDQDTRVLTIPALHPHTGEIGGISLRDVDRKNMAKYIDQAINHATTFCETHRLTDQELSKQISNATIKRTRMKPASQQLLTTDEIFQEQNRDIGLPPQDLSQDRWWER